LEKIVLLCFGLLPRDNIGFFRSSSALSLFGIGSLPWSLVRPFRF
jgi:hypothetical protein